MAKVNSRVKTRGIKISNNTTALGDELEEAIYEQAKQLRAKEVVINQFVYNKSAEVDMFKDQNGGLIGFGYAVRV